MKHIAILFMFLQLTGCLALNPNFVNPPPPPYKEKDFGSFWVWENEEITSKLKSKEISSDSATHQKRIAESQCLMESYKINAEKSVQLEVMKSCMFLKGWEQVSYRNIDFINIESGSDQIPLHEINRLISKTKMAGHWKKHIPSAWDIFLRSDKALPLSSRMQFTTLMERIENLEAATLISICSDNEIEKCAELFPEAHTWKLYDNQRWTTLLKDIPNINTNDKDTSELKSKFGDSFANGALNAYKVKKAISLSTYMGADEI